jgi:hypothetical protein
MNGADSTASMVKCCVAATDGAASSDAPKARHDKPASVFKNDPPNNALLR